jgi:hypothetical protein
MIIKKSVVETPTNLGLIFEHIIALAEVAILYKSPPAGILNYDWLKPINLGINANKL